MAKVLIVEDEYLVRVGLRTCIDWEINGFTLLDDAVDGLDAYQKIIKYKPDILLLDLKMPRMNGFELMDKLKEEKIKINIVVLSCCDDFESVRTALKHGVLDYVNKLTINPDELISVLNKISINSVEDSDFTNTIESAATLDPSLLLSLLINQQADLTAEEQEFFGQGYLSYLILTSRKPKTSVSSSITLNMVRQVLKNCGVESIITVSQQDGILIALPDNADRNTVAKALKDQLEPTLDTYCTIGFSAQYNNFSQVNERYHCVCQVADELFWNRPKSVRVYSEKLVMKPEHKAFYKSVKKAVYNNICANNLYGVISETENFFSYFTQSDNIPKDAFIQYSNSVFDLFQTNDLLENKFYQVQKKIINADNILILRQEMLDFINNYFNNTDSFIGYSPIVEQAIKYVIDNPSRFVQLTEVSQHVNVSKPYLSQLFKKETGVNFVTYVHRYKINLAKQMLNDNIRVCEVCEKIGFENANYFTKIFKRFTGVSPTDYRNDPVKS